MPTTPIHRNVAIVGLYETRYYKHSGSPDPEFKMALEAIMGAAADAGIAVTDIDGFASYADDRNDPIRLASALGLPDVRFSNMQWGGGGGGGSGAVANAAAAVACGYANYVVVYRALAQGQFGRASVMRAGGEIPPPASYTMPYGIIVPAQIFALRAMRFMHEHGVKQSALRAVAMASYHHAQQNPGAVMYGRPLTEAAYDDSRWIAEPYHLFDCCQENDGAAAMIVTSAERARDLRQKPAYLLGCAIGNEFRAGARAHNDANYASSNFKNTAQRLYAMAGVGPQDVDVLQSYENFTGGVVMSIVEHGFCTPEEVNAFFTTDTFYAPHGRLPLNTSGGNLAHCYMHGLELNIEAVKQVRGTSYNQVPEVRISMVTSGPMVQPTTNMIVAP